VLLSGSVEMRKRTSGDALIATFRPMTERPWFGEIAMLGGGKKRTCAAVCADQVKVLMVRHSHFAVFLEVAPAFHSMFISSASGYAALDEMRRKLEGEDDVLKSGVALLRSKMGDFLSEGASSAMPFGDGAGDDADDEGDNGDDGELTHEQRQRQQAVLTRYESLTRGLLAKERLNKAAETEAREAAEGLSDDGDGDGDGGGGGPHDTQPRRIVHRRVSYVAGVDRSLDDRNR
jgi:hypothetical protein